MSIVLDKVSCVYDEGTANERYALKCVSTQIEPGEFIGVIVIPVPVNLLLCRF